MPDKPLPYSVIPISHEPRPDELTLIQHLVHHRSQSCRNCGQSASWSEVWDVYLLRGSRRLMPSMGLKKSVPIGITKLPSKSTPACFECVEKLGEGCGDTRVDRLSEIEWERTVKRKQEEADQEARRRARASTARASTPSAPRPIPSADS